MYHYLPLRTTRYCRLVIKCDEISLLIDDAGNGADHPSPRMRGSVWSVKRGDGRWNGRRYLPASPERLVQRRAVRSPVRQQAPTGPQRPHPETNMAAGRPETMPDWVASERRRSDPRYKACHYRRARAARHCRDVTAMHVRPRRRWSRISSSFVAVRPSVRQAPFDLQLYAASIRGDLVTRSALTSLSAARGVGDA